MATSETSIMIFVGVSGFRCDNSVAVANAPLAAIKAAMASSDQDKGLVPSLEENCEGCKMSGMKQ